VDLHTIVTDTLPRYIESGKSAGETLVLPGDDLTWTPTITAPGGVWTQQVVVTVEMGYGGPLTNVVRVTTEEGATGVYTETTQAYVTPRLRVTKNAAPDPVHPGRQLTYTLMVSNLGNVNLHATITDTLPLNISPGKADGGTEVRSGGRITWTPTITAPGGIWLERIIVTVENGYSGTLTNEMYVTTEEGATGIYTETSVSRYNSHLIYLPLLMRYTP
jgi:uncharacterized repeat protein (TIGR01451 family)